VTDRPQLIILLTCLRDTESGDAVSDYLSTPTPPDAPAGCVAPTCLLSHSLSLPTSQTHASFSFLAVYNPQVFYICYHRTIIFLYYSTRKSWSQNSCPRPMPTPPKKSLCLTAKVASCGPLLLHLSKSDHFLGTEWGDIREIFARMENVWWLASLTHGKVKRGSRQTLGASSRTGTWAFRLNLRPLKV